MGWTRLHYLFMYRQATREVYSAYAVPTRTGLARMKKTDTYRIPFLVDTGESPGIQTSFPYDMIFEGMKSLVEELTWT